MLNLSKYNQQFIDRLNEQLAVYTTIGTPKIESPMWFQFNKVDHEEKTLYFRSSQVNYMFFRVDLLPEDENYYFDYRKTYDHFKALKYSHIKEFWPTVYYELRPEEKPIQPIIKKADAPIVKTEPVNYEKQATDFLRNTNTTFKATYKTHGLYFNDDKHSRDIYTIILKNNAGRYRFNFGQSVSNSDGKTAPTPYDVLACLTKYEVGTFQDFCDNYGYDIDSRKAYKTYKAVLREWKNIQILFTNEQIKLLQEIN